ncbi:uncharacterized protein N7469_002349 [Penicillium citrinum]|uniref:Ecp2 effector protein domain-containing protein n=1 Tax=Penicillium citrinum TaxID=5077 RepID=A0A9W9TU44_PENCI|nr:uncharacterized protein N7469_002349 [Penicillium citrinum]KAJ5240758.1 hypothetical protein N7469_002349 [Penicillium citrinum]KAK5789796.1 hypothetical protein VI817_008919 [Penicillium citrinum]
MYFKQAFIASVAVLSPAVLGNITCETTDGSPEIADVTDVINYLNGHAGTFEPDIYASSKCRTVANVGSAAVAMCGDEGYSGTDLGKDALDIQNECLNDGRVGGTKHLDNGDRIEVIHS